MKGLDFGTLLLIGGAGLVGLYLWNMNKAKQAMYANRAYNTTYKGIITDSFALMDPYVSANEFYTYNTLPWIQNPVSTFDPTQANFSALGGYNPPGGYI